jgi:hypothetical protein
MTQGLFFANPDGPLIFPTGVHRFIIGDLGSGRVDICLFFSNGRLTGEKCCSIDEAICPQQTVFPV